MKLQAELVALQLEYVPGMAVVVAEQMQVIARHIDRAGVAGRPEAHQGAGHVLQIERCLGIGGTDQIHSGLSLAGHPIADPLKHPTQTNRHKKVGVVAQSVEPRGEIGPTEVGAFYWTVPAPDIVNSGREEQGSVSV